MSSAVASSRLGAFDTIISGLFTDIDLSPIMVYLVDVCSEAALPWLAYQFDVEGFKGYDQCKTVDQKRELIKNAINIHRYSGTIYSIRLACESVGYTLLRVDENVPLTTGGSSVWCAFNVLLSPDDISNFDTDSMHTLRSLIENHKNARSILHEIAFEISTEDKIFTSDEEDRDELEITGGIDVDGSYSLDYNNDYF